MEEKFINWNFKKAEVEGEKAHCWAEFYFECPEDPKCLMVGQSPVYYEGNSDFHYLVEDSQTIAHKLKNGAAWNQVCGQFRQNW